jgi:hypothetical protein
MDTVLHETTDESTKRVVAKKSVHLFFSCRRVGDKFNPCGMVHHVDYSTQFSEKKFVLTKLLKCIASFKNVLVLKKR